MPKISVILPVYNAQGFLEESVASILAQDFSDFELIVMDDGSTDSSLQILKAIPDPRIILHSEKKTGLTKLLNMGIGLAAGEYIARMDADDISAPNRFSRQLKALEADPGLAAVGCWYHIVDGSGKILAERTPPTSPAEIKDKFFSSAPIAHPAAMFRKNALLSVGGYDEEFECSQDRDLFLRLLHKWRLGVVPEFLFSLRVSPGSITLARENSQKRFSLLAVERAIRAGLYPKRYMWRVIFKRLLLSLPPFAVRFKNSIMRILGYRYDSGL